MQDQGRDITKQQGSADLTEQQILKQGALYEAGTKAEWYQRLTEYSELRISQASSELIFKDHQTLDEICFLKGQIAGILDIKARPEKIIQLRKQIIEEREEKAKKKKEKEKKRARG